MNTTLARYAAELVEIDRTHPRASAIWLRRDGVSATGLRLRVLVETDRGWVIAIDVPWPGGEGELSHIVEPRAIPDCPVDPVTGGQR